MANSERWGNRVRTVSEPPKISKPNWWIFKEIAKRMGSDWASNSAQELLDNEISGLVPQLAGFIYSHLEGNGFPFP